MSSNDGWLASSAIYLDSSYATFGMLYASSGIVGMGILKKSTGGSYNCGCGVRPLVSLDSMIKIDTSDISRDGSTAAKAWKLVRK